jgi:hypothetical protein
LDEIERFSQPQAAAVDCRSGGARRDRTDDLLLAKQALSQLSYGPFRNQMAVIRDRIFGITIDATTIDATLFR